MLNRRTSGYWTGFPATYRAEQVAVIMRWLAAGESGTVIGGSGAGKSNLAGFLSSRPDAIKPYVGAEAEKFCFLRLDINSLPQLTAPNFYRGLFYILREVIETLDPEMQGAAQLIRGQIDWQDSFEVLITLQKAHHLLIGHTDKQVVWLLDRFDVACQKLDAQTLNSLRSLRDQFKGRLSYIVFTRRPLARLRDPGEIDEFHELIVANTCWVGPMVDRDARWIARQMADRLQVNFDDQAVDQLLHVTGGLPAFMKLACQALAEGAISSEQSAQEWTGLLLARPEFQRNCQEIWAELSPEEQNLLFALSGGAAETVVDADILVYLEQAGLLMRPKQAAPAKGFSPILDAFIQQQHDTAGGRLELHPKTRAVTRAGITLDIELTPHEDRLLSYFLERTGEVCQKDVLIRSVWPDDDYYEGISDDRLAQLVKRLREKIEPDPRQPVYIQTVWGQGYRFVQPEA